MAAISSKELVNSPEFEKGCKEFHGRLREIYPWKRISPTVHFLIAHGPAVMNYFGGITGVYTEEAQERTNKDFRAARLDHARKNSRLNNLTDIAHWMLEESDPILY